MINRGPVIGGSYKTLRKAVQRQLNSIHVKHPIAKHRCLGDEDIVFSERDARGSDNHMTIERYNTKRVLVDNGSSADGMCMGRIGLD